MKPTNERNATYVFAILAAIGWALLLSVTYFGVALSVEAIKSGDEDWGAILIAIPVSLIPPSALIASLVAPFRLRRRGKEREAYVAASRLFGGLLLYFVVGFFTLAIRMGSN